MTAQSAVSICESDLGCSGFTYWGSVRLANSTRGQEFDVKFFKNVDHMAKNNMFNIGWTTYKVRSRNFVVFKGRPVPKGREVEMGAKHRALVDAVKGWKKAGSKANIDWPDQSKDTYYPEPPFKIYANVRTQVTLPLVLTRAALLNQEFWATSNFTRGTLSRTGNGSLC